MGQRKDATVKISADLARDAKIVAAFREISLAEYLSETLRPLVDRDLRKALLERSSEHLKLDPRALEADGGSDVQDAPDGR